MNALSYALLSMLFRKSCSGYELMKMMGVFWQAKHSQIYPLLAKLEQKELVTYEHVGQTGKPDKKLYSITDLGTAALKEWIDHSPAAVPVQRDEFLIKVYAIGLSDPNTAIQLFEERIAMLMEKAAYLQSQVSEMDELMNGMLPGMNDKHFGRYLLYQRRVLTGREEIEWCKWAMSLIAKPSGQARPAAEE
ncbi:PadR family transcriptional regulator [Paenibacillus mendelii]|uniref:PadR family transcriptional regulator n=1 Tax=Paenibacillus mendelii TaxID=206163 RepID=A0ABV6JE31_9BACL|nr:PadR family transcriptional regulator [Paenibacillus mendelii]MCQ6562430.1 PadR family transcriptional regulator [Paenibacillus mendelii]